jgi:hypothetical protein
MRFLLQSRFLITRLPQTRSAATEPPHEHWSNIAELSPDRHPRMTESFLDWQIRLVSSQLAVPYRAESNALSE